MVIATVVPAAGSGAATTTPAVTSPPVTEQSTGPVANWGTAVDTDGRVYLADAKGRALTLQGFNDKTSDASASGDPRHAPGRVGQGVRFDRCARLGEVHEGENLLTAAARVEREQITPMYQRIADEIAAVDADHWVFIEPPNLASLGIPTSMGPVHGRKVAFYPHLYDTSLETS